jgi:hypothetical protein
LFMRSLILPVVAASALALGGCASNYAGEGAVAGGAAGALLGAATGGNVGTGAAIGAAAGAVGGTLIKKDRDRCYYRAPNGREYWDRC